MSLLYKPKDEQTTTCEIKQEDGKIVLDFYSDCGKFGTDEWVFEHKGVIKKRSKSKFDCLLAKKEIQKALGV